MNQAESHADPERSERGGTCFVRHDIAGQESSSLATLGMTPGKLLSS